MWCIKKVTGLYALIEFAVRVYLAFFLVDYGISKFTGNMFNNTTLELLKTELAKVDLFHLTWYWFQRNKLLSYAVGFFQVASALLLLWPRTVLLGVMIAFPILLNILLIDIYCVGMPDLAMRVAFYLFLLLFFCYYRRQSIRVALRALLQHRSSPYRWYLRLALLPVCLGLWFGMEVLVSRFLVWLFY